jgi:non-ribosomal peptide synthetase component E (peptide arylation enzyme)
MVVGKLSVNGITVERVDFTLFDLLDGCVARCGERLFLDDGRRQITFAEFRARVERAAAGLAERGLGRGDFVLLQLPNLVEFAEAHLAAGRLGAVSVPLLPLYREKELRHFLDLFSPKMAVIASGTASYDLAECYRRLQDESGWTGTVIDLQPADGDQPFEEICRSTGRLAERPQPDDVFVAFVTSGITGTPKGAIRTHGQAALMGSALADKLASADGVSLSYFPVAHLGGVGNGIYRSLGGRSTTLLRGGFAPQDCLDLVRERGVTNLFLPVPHIVTLLDHVSEEKPELAASLRQVQVETGGTSPPSPVVKGVQQRLGARLINQYGMSEGLTSTTRPDDPPEYPSSGRSRPLECELRVFDTQAGHEASDGEFGEIQVRGPLIFKGYHREPERTAAAFTPDGWFRTGDVGYLDGAGNVVMTGRVKDVINRGGEKISAPEIENELMGHPAITACAVVPAPDRRLGERACAFVVLRPGFHVDLPEVQGFLDERGVSKVKWPERLEIVDSLPMTSTGKVQKYLLVAAIGE